MKIPLVLLSGLLSNSTLWHYQKRDLNEVPSIQIVSQSLLPGISCPTLVIHAACDQNFSLEEHRELATAIPKAELAQVKNSGHMSPMEVPQAITDLLRQWLTN